MSQIIASSGRQNILRALTVRPEINITQLVTNINGTYNEVMRNVRILEGEGVVRLIRKGRQVVVSLNNESCKANTLIDILEFLDSRSEL